MRLRVVLEFWEISSKYQLAVSAKSFAIF